MLGALPPGISESQALRYSSLFCFVEMGKLRFKEKQWVELALDQPTPADLPSSWQYRAWGCKAVVGSHSSSTPPRLRFLCLTLPHLLPNFSRHLASPAGDTAYAARLAPSGPLHRPPLSSLSLSRLSLESSTPRWDQGHLVQP